MSTSTTTAARVFVTETVHPCSDGVKLATRRWANFDTTSKSNRDIRSRKILCLHGWLDNAASYNRLAPLLLESASSSTDETSAGATIPTEIVGLDFPGHGLSGHKSVDGPPQLIAEYAFYVAELVDALQWGNSNKSDEKYDKMILIGHSMGSGVSFVLCAAFPEWFSSLILLEGGLVARDAQDAPKHVRAACQRRMKSNRSLFPNGANNESGVLPRARVYANLDAAIEARLSTTRRMPGDQYLSFEAAKDMVMRATVPAHVASASASATDNGGIVFRHDPRLQWPSLQYYTREQVEAFFRDVQTSNIPVCFLYAADGWPADSWAEGVIQNVLKPVHFKRLSGSHHFHADPDSVAPAAHEIVSFLKEQKL